MFSNRVKNLIPYVPGEQPQDKAYIKLNTNENPYPPSPHIEALLKELNIENLRLYPDPQFGDLRKAIGESYGVKSDQIFVGNGSDEVLSFVFYAFFDSADGPLLFPEFTYSFYPVYCEFYGIAYKKVPLADDFSIQIDGLLGNDTSCGIVFPNPNAPTGILISVKEIARLLDAYPKNRVVVIDEAYIAFGGESAMSLIQQYPNLLVVRTFSKSMALASARLGYAIGDEQLIEKLYTVKDSFNSYPVSMLAQQIGAIAIKDKAYYDSITQKIVDAREYLSKELTRLEWEVLPSKANFVFARKPGVEGRAIYAQLKDRGILVRYFDLDGIKDFVRITIGTRESLETLVSEVKALF
jgi:histidinol-phosphate aminotransferase